MFLTSSSDDISRLYTLDLSVYAISTSALRASVDITHKHFGHGIQPLLTTQYGQDPTDELLAELLYEANSFADGLDNIHIRRYKDNSKYTAL